MPKHARDRASAPPRRRLALALALGLAAAALALFALLRAAPHEHDEIDPASRERLLEVLRAEPEAE